MSYTLPADGNTPERPHLGWWLSILGGLTLLALLAFDSATYGWWCAHVTATVPQRLLRRIFLAAVLTHVVEAAYARHLTQRLGLGSSAPHWILQTFLLGYPSLRLLRRRAR